MNKRLYILFGLLLCALNASAVKVVFRCDDPTVQYDSVHNRILQLFIEKGVPLSIGIVPCDSDEMAFKPNDTEYLELLKQPLFEVCMHGMTHSHSDGTKGEFDELDTEEVGRRIIKGKTILTTCFDKKIITFIPPYKCV